MELTRWVQFGLFGLLWALIAGSNIASLIDARRRGGSASLTLFLGGIFGIIAVLICPIPGAWMGFWIPALLDPGSLPALYRLLRGHEKNQGRADRP